MHWQICSYYKLFPILRWELTLYCPGSLPLYSNTPYQGKKPPVHKRILQNSEKLGPHPSKCENKRRHWVFSDIQLLSWNITTTLCNKWHRLWNSEKQRCLTNAIGSWEWQLSKKYFHILTKMKGKTFWFQGQVRPNLKSGRVCYTVGLLSFHRILVSWENCNPLIKVGWWKIEKVSYTLSLLMKTDFPFNQTNLSEWESH